MRAWGDELGVGESRTVKDTERRLDSWKEIAVFFGRDERTVKRWEHQRGLPVRRVPGGQRNRVFAYAHELEHWLKNGALTPEAPSRLPEIAPLADDAPEPDGPSPFAPAGSAGEVVALPASPVLTNRLPGAGESGWVPSVRRRRWAVLAALLALVLGLSLVVLARDWPATGHVPPKAAQDFYLTGVYFLEKRTPESLLDAVSQFEKAVEIDPAYAKAYSGLADTYNLLRQFSVMPPAEAYPLAERAARKAVDLDPAEAEAQGSLAFIEFYWLRRVDEGLERFDTALALDPGSSRIRHWRANALLHLGRFKDALAAIESARRIEPASRSILASKGLILFSAGYENQARTLLANLAKAEPDFQSPRAYLAYVDLASGNYPAYLDDLEAVAELMHDADRSAVAKAGRLAFAEGGFPALIAAMLKEERRLFATGTGFAYNIARLEALSGDWRDALANLRLSLARREQYIMSLNVDPAFRSIRANPDYRRLVTDVGLPNID